MTPIVLDLAAARRWAVTSRALLSESRERIDRLNVFPVPDGDTGTNMFLTVDGALGYLRHDDDSTSNVVRLTDGLDSLAHGMLLSARGNSGVILSQLAQGMAHAMRARVSGGDVMDAVVLAEAFRRAADLAWAGVSSPVEGTILSVARAAAGGAAAAVQGLDRGGWTAPDRDQPHGGGQAEATYAVAHQALVAARAALAHTPEQLPSLARAGVVDAGGAGFVLVLEALESVLADRPHEGATAAAQSWVVPVSLPSVLPGPCGHGESEEGGTGGSAYEVMYLLEDSTPERAEALRHSLVAVGDSVMVVGGPTQWRVHVHLDHTSAALAAGSRAGRIEHVTVTSLAPSPEVATSSGEGARLGLVCCAPGEAIGEVFAQAGVIIVPSSAGRRASTGELLRAARSSPADRIAILPNDPDTVLAAQAAARAGAAEGLAITVLPTLAVVQGLAAISVWDPRGHHADAALTAMTRAAAGVSYGALTIAVADGPTPVGRCVQGQWLGLVGSDIVSVADEAPAVMGDVLRIMAQRLGEPPELLTIVMGSRATTGAIDEVIERWCTEVNGSDVNGSNVNDAELHDGHVDDVEVRVLYGGQRTFHWLVGLE